MQRSCEVHIQQQIRIDDPVQFRNDMKVLQIKFNVMGDIDGKVMEALSETLVNNGVKYWSAEISTLFDLDDEEIETLKSQSKKPVETVPQSIFEDPDVVWGVDEGFHEFSEDVGDLRYGPLSLACKMCTNHSEACMLREFSKMEILDDTSHPPYIMVICSDFQSTTQ
jgi:hypothetical protein